MQTEYFVNVSDLRVFLLDLRSRDVRFEVLAFRQKCKKFKIPYFVYQVNYGGDM